MPDLVKYLNSSPGELPSSGRPPGRSPGASASRSRETAGMPSVERFLGEEVDLVGRTLAGYRIDRKRVIMGGALSDGGGLYHWLKNNLRLKEDDNQTENEIAKRAPDAPSG